MKTKNPSNLSLIELQKKLEKIEKRKKIKKQILLAILTTQLIIFGTSQENTQIKNTDNNGICPRIAFYIQNLKIKDDKSIGNPDFFAKIPYEYKSTVIYIKDSDPKILDAYRHKKLSVKEKQRYMKELIENQKNQIKQDNER